MFNQSNKENSDELSRCSAGRLQKFSVSNSDCRVEIESFYGSFSFATDTEYIKTLCKRISYQCTLRRPCRSTCFSLGWSTKFFAPPVTEIRSLGSSSFHSLQRRRRAISGSVSWDTRIYWSKKRQKKRECYKLVGRTLVRYVPNICA